MELTDTGLTVYNRTYSRTKPDGTREEWADTVARVVDGNLALIPDTHHWEKEREALIELMTEFKIIPAGRHLWASGVKGRQYLFNCWNSGWTEDITDHFEFTFLRLMEGGGVGSNYSNSYLAQYPEILGWDNSYFNCHPYNVHIVCDPSHPDYQVMADAGLLSAEYVSDWDGAYEVDDSREGWAHALVDLLETYYRPALNRNRVFDVSRVRGAGERLKTFGGSASGPAPLAVMLHEVAEVMNARIGGKLDGIGAMEIDHAIATCVVSGGNRRSARMSIMRWDDPQIFDFMKVKETSGKHWTTNISVEVTDEFWNEQQFCGSQAKEVLHEISAAMLSNGEPGIWNSDLSNLGEPTPVTSTNPCGEIPLVPFEPCNLGHINLAAFVNPDTGAVDTTGMAVAHELMTRFLIRATYADVNDPKSRAVLDTNRRIGVGHLGVASYLGMVGIPYSVAAHDENFYNLLRLMRNCVSETAREYAHDLRIPVPVKTRTVAPTGTIAKMPGVSEGIHPIFAQYFLRRIRFSDVDESQREAVEDYRARGYQVEPCRYAPNTSVVTIPTKDTLVEAAERIHGSSSVVESAADLVVADMLAMQELYQRVWADNAVSYTVNLKADAVTPESLAAALMVYGPKLKGTTVFPETSHLQSPYERISEADFALYEYGRETGDGVDENCSTGSCPVR